MSEFRRGPPRIIICGAPASGKGTQCEFIKEEFGVVHLSTGDILRAAVQAGSALGLEAKKFMDQGKLVTDELIINLVMARLQERDCVEQGWLLDGFPRTGAQADALAQSGVECDAFIQLDVDDKLLVERVVGRRMDPQNGKIYHLKYSPPDENDHALMSRLVHRSDDTEEKVAVRIQAYHTNLAAIVDKFQGKVIEVNGNRHPALVWAEIRSRVTRRWKYEVVFVLGGPGCGKGTVCQKLSTALGYCHLSAGDLLRDEQSKGGEYAEMIKTLALEGKLVPAHITVALLAQAMKAAFQSRKCCKFLIDGFPRNKENVTAWFAVMGEISVLDMVLNLHCDESVMKERLLQRAETSGRSDDNEATMIKRFQTFTEQTKPVLGLFDRMNRVRTVDASLPPDMVFNAAKRLIAGIQLIPSYERTFAFIKPDAVSLGHIPAIHKAIAAANLSIAFTKLVQLDNDTMAQFYAEHVNKSFFPRLQSFMTSGPSLAMVIEGSDAVRAWRVLMGPTNTAVAQVKAPTSLRALYGSDDTCNACHGSDSQASALREIDFWMDPKGSGAKVTLATNDEDGLRLGVGLGGLANQDTYAMIKPFSAQTVYDEVMTIIAVHGFEVVHELKTKFSLSQTEQFYGEHKDKPFFEELTTYMSSKPIVALQLRRSGAIAAWRHLIGPTNFIKAQTDRPDSIRAKFALDGTRNCCHGSDANTSAARELAFMFGGVGRQSALPLTLSTSSSSSPAKTLAPIKGGYKPRNDRKVHTVPSISKADIALMHAYACYDVDPIMNSLMQRLLVTRPTDVAGFAIKELTEIRQQRINNNAVEPNTSVPNDNIGDESVCTEQAVPDDEMNTSNELTMGDDEE